MSQCFGKSFNTSIESNHYRKSSSIDQCVHCSPVKRNIFQTNHFCWNMFSSSDHGQCSIDWNRLQINFIWRFRKTVWFQSKISWTNLCWTSLANGFRWNSSFTASKWFILFLSLDRFKEFLFLSSLFRHSFNNIQLEFGQISWTCLFLRAIKIFLLDCDPKDFFKE